MHSTRRFLSLSALSLGLALSPTLTPLATATEAPSPQASILAGQKAEQKAAPTILKTEHTDAVALALVGRELELFTYADLPGANRTRLDPATTIFNLEDRNDTRIAVPQGFDFIGPAGSQMWLAPQTQIQGVIWPGWNTEDIRAGALRDDVVNLELVEAKTPEGASVEVFQVAAFGDPTRVFSSDEDLGAYAQPVAAHVHANWAFTHLGRYELTFRASATLADGTPVSAEQTYTFVVGEVEQEASPSASAEPTASPVATPTAAPTVLPSPSLEPSEPASPEPSEEPSEGAELFPSAEPSDPAAETEKPEASSDVPRPARTGQQGGGSAPVVGGGSQPRQVVQEQVRQAPASGGNQAPAPRAQGQQQAPAQEQCRATEQVVKAAEGGRATADRAAFNQADYAIRRAVHPGANKALEGHFDFGAVLSNGQLSAQIKDDRTSPAVWKQTGALNFVLGDSAKMKMPAGMEHIAPAGQEVYLIGATQQAKVPWLGWNTQNPELIQQAEGEATMTLKSVTGPGRVLVFLSGNFGAAGTTVFNGVGDSFRVPLNTHQHGNWVFTEQGNYSMTIEWSVKLKDGSTKTAQGTLGFIVGNAPEPAPAQGGGSQGSAGGSGSQGQQDQGIRKEEPRGSVDEASGLVTKADGSQVRIVGKTADGRDCTLSESALKEAQKASAEGRLAYTGAQAGPVLVVGLGALLAGGLALGLARRRRAS